MIIKPSKEDYFSIAFFTGRTMIIVGLAAFIPLITAIGFGEWDPALDYVITILICFALGIFCQRLFRTHKEINWLSGMAAASLSWLVVMALSAIPLYLSGHYSSYLDACFDGMSGIATTGLALIQDMDHVSYAHNMWRHFLMFLGGQGILVIGLTFFLRGTAGAFRMYVGEAREEKIMPNVIQTARFIWGISLVYLILGTAALGSVGLFLGQSLANAFMHGAWIFMAAFDTGGFAPSSASVLYYHSFTYEIITVILMILGTINFAVHYAVWTGNIKEFFKNIEVRTLFFTMALTSLLAWLGWLFSHTYASTSAIFRKGVYQIISGHSGTGFQTIYSPQFLDEWHPLAYFIVIIAMGLGGSACSTAGGIKALRICLNFKAMVQDVKKIMTPGGSIIIEKFHHIKDMALQDNLVRSALMITLAYIITYLLGACAGVFYGYSLAESSFESVSACANVGLSCGLTSAAMPTGLKITYIVQMWVGRLEFMSVFALMGFIVARFRGK